MGNRVLRAGLAPEQATDGPGDAVGGLFGDRDLVWRASTGTAAVLGLRPTLMDAPPTTAYLMLGERCLRDCAFCAQARTSRADVSALSRVHWPAFDPDDVAEAVGEAYRQGRIGRACFQLTVGRNHVARAATAVRRLARSTLAPICASATAANVEDVFTLLDAGAERVSLALDAACEEAYRRAKGGSWPAALHLLEDAARQFPGRIGTHLIVGLGEAERDVAELLGWLGERGITVALFALTPVPGTRMEAAEPPALAAYRRIQALRWLLAEGETRLDALRFDDDGRLRGMGLTPERLADALASGDAFRTSGCRSCNRPYYNERPGHVPYNYPRPLTADEARREVDALLRDLEA